MQFCTSDKQIESSTPYFGSEHLNKMEIEKLVSRF